MCFLLIMPIDEQINIRIKNRISLNSFDEKTFIFK